MRYSNNITSLLIIIHIPTVSVTVTLQLKWLSFLELIRESLTIEPHYWSGFTWLNTVTYHRSQILLYLHVQIKVDIFKFDNTFYCYFFMIFLFHYHVFECLRVKSISVFANLVSHFFYSNSPSVGKCISFKLFPGLIFFHLHSDIITYVINSNIPHIHIATSSLNIIYSNKECSVSALKKIAFLLHSKVFQIKP